MAGRSKEDLQVGPSRCDPLVPTVEPQTAVRAFGLPGAAQDAFTLRVGRHGDPLAASAAVASNMSGLVGEEGRDVHEDPAVLDPVSLHTKRGGRRKGRDPGTAFPV